VSDQPGKAEGCPVSQVRGVLAERVVVSTPLDPFLSLRALSDYSGLSTRTLRNHLLAPGHPLPYYRIGGKIIVRTSEYDAWAARYRHLGSPDLDRVATEAMRDLRLSRLPRRQATTAP
jgi:hypothetical protein